MSEVHQIDELKPCPFCGGDAKRMTITDEAREAIARIIDPRAWRSVEQMTADIMSELRFATGEEEREAAHGLAQDNFDAAANDREASLAKASAILATPPQAQAPTTRLPLEG